ncbi:MAG: hypothetical protein ACLRTD_26060, partial [Bacteroides sp.]
IKEIPLFLICFFPVFTTLQRKPADRPRFEIRFLLSLLINSEAKVLNFGVYCHSAMLILRLLACLKKSNHEIHPDKTVHTDPLTE